MGTGAEREGSGQQGTGRDGDCTQQGPGKAGDCACQYSTHRFNMYKHTQISAHCTPKRAPTWRCTRMLLRVCALGCRGGRGRGLVCTKVRVGRQIVQQRAGLCSTAERERPCSSHNHPSSAPPGSSAAAPASACPPWRRRRQCSRARAPRLLAAAALLSPAPPRRMRRFPAPAPAAACAAAAPPRLPTAWAPWTACGRGEAGVVGVEWVGAHVRVLRCMQLLWSQWAACSGGNWQQLPHSTPAQQGPHAHSTLIIHHPASLSTPTCSACSTRGRRAWRGAAGTPRARPHRRPRT